MNSPHKWPVTRKMFPFDDVIMNYPYVVSYFTHGMYQAPRNVDTCSTLLSFVGFLTGIIFPSGLFLFHCDTLVIILSYPKFGDLVDCR